VNWLLPVYVMLITAGYFVFRSEATMVKGNALSGDRALFAAVNVATLTGLQVSVGPDQFLQGGRVAVFVITALAAFLSMLIGASAVVRIVRLPYSDLRIAGWSLGTCAVATALGWAALSGGETSAFDAAFMGLSAFANSGLHFGPLPGVFSWQAQLVLAPLAVIGGLGLPVVMELFDRVMGRRAALSFYSRTVLGMTAGIYVVTTALFCWMLTHWGNVDWRTALATASATSIDARTCGLGYQFANGLPRAMQWALMAAMLVGAGSAGTAGGLKVTTAAELWGGVRRALRGDAAGRAFGIAAVWTLTYIAVIGVSQAVLVSVAPQVPADRMLFDLVSAVGNVGLSTDVLSIVGAPLYVLSAAMFFGRFAPLLILWWVADTTADAELPVG
jgi:Trk-type K+ transport system membrane component